MVATRARDTLPERRLRSAAHRRGLRFRVCARPVPAVRRTADLVFARERLAVFVDGCFWHGCPDHFVVPHTNADFWTRKLTRNKERDRETDAILVAAGWTVLRVWEHADPAAASELLLRTVTGLRESRDSERSTSDF
jgi:DNA mismatch endonuclease (patch repair protein)